MTGGEDVWGADDILSDLGVGGGMILEKHERSVEESIGLRYVLFVILHASWSERLLEHGLEPCSVHRKPSLDSIFLYETLCHGRAQD